MSSQIHFGTALPIQPLPQALHLKSEAKVPTHKELNDEICLSRKYNLNGRYEYLPKLSSEELLKKPIILTKDIIKKGYEVQKTYRSGTRFKSLQALAYDLSLDLDPTNGMEKMFHEVHISNPIDRGNTNMIMSQLSSYNTSFRFIQPEQTVPLPALTSAQRKLITPYQKVLMPYLSLIRALLFM